MFVISRDGPEPWSGTGSWVTGHIHGSQNVTYCQPCFGLYPLFLSLHLFVCFSATFVIREILWSKLPTLPMILILAMFYRDALGYLLTGTINVDVAVTERYSCPIFISRSRFYQLRQLRVISYKFFVIHSFIQAISDKWHPVHVDTCSSLCTLPTCHPDCDFDPLIPTNFLQSHYRRQAGLPSLRRQSLE